MKNFSSSALFWRLLLAVIFCQTFTTTYAQQKLDLSGTWSVALDSSDVGITENWINKSFRQEIKLPGTLDDAAIGIPNALKPAMEKLQLTHLTRKNRYVGAAWYTKEVQIPKDWSGKKVALTLERALWKTSVWVNGQKIAQDQNSLIAPHYFDLTGYLQAGKSNRITIRIDNRKLFDLSYQNMAHAYTDHTQIIWNGVIGNMLLEAFDQIAITDLQTFPSADNKSVLVKAQIENHSNRTLQADIQLQGATANGSQLIGSKNSNSTLAPGKNEVEYRLTLGASIDTWDEFHPNLYQLKLAVKAQKSATEKTVNFGFRHLETDGIKMVLNGNPIFLRGTLECNIFPLTGHPPMDKQSWTKLIQTAKNWGLNHLRFHSWCPPKAAFEAADELGMYLQVELPVWSLTIGDLQPTTDFLYAEAHHIMTEYGNHPSFLFWSMGNELQGDMSVLNKLVDHLKAMDRRKLYANTSFTFEKGHGDRPEYNDDILVTQWTTDGWVRGQGVFNDYSPTFDKNYDASLSNVSVPVITHEIGQYAVYPNLREIDKYTGVLDPLNFKAIREDLKNKGLYELSDKFLQSSGKLAAILYKEEIERALKTGGISGFQLLDLHDFPGQGTALVGLLDAFWDSKGIMDSTDFKQFNAPVVPLLNFEKATYQNTDIFTADLAVSNYYQEYTAPQTLTWRMLIDGAPFRTGKLQTSLKLGFNNNLGSLSVPLSEIKQATKVTLELELEGSTYRNVWSIWVYPAAEAIDFGDIIYTRNVDEALKNLEKGKKVLLNPDWKTVTGVEGKFVPVFWSPVHFPKQAGTMGLLLDNQHPVFHDFPTDNHTDWQWWDLHRNSTTMIIDSLAGGKPLVQMIDNFANNRKLALMMEGRVGSGKLLFTTIDLQSNLQDRAVANQMLQSIVRYMQSADFDPVAIQNLAWLSKSLKTTEQKQDKKDASAIY